MSDENVRQIQVLGAKPKDLIRRRRTRKRAVDEEGEEEEKPQPQPQVPVIVSKVIAAPPPKPSVEVTTPTPDPVPAVLKPKVVLKPKLKQTPKVLLKKKEEQPTPANSVGGAIQKPKTRKVVLHSLGKRVNKTRHAVAQAKDLSIDHIRAVLIDKKLIKPVSKAPESILRQIYSDSLIVAKKTL